ncbi:MAG TPA: hypothetical protein VG125_29285 [Pirellulales bacterium]|nr:hypothetical protein [Pirellulales bacterium]
MEPDASGPTVGGGTVGGVVAGPAVGGLTGAAGDGWLVAAFGW